MLIGLVYQHAPLCLIQSEYIVCEALTFDEGIAKLWDKCDFFLLIPEHCHIELKNVQKFRDYFNEYTGIVYSDGVGVYNESYNRGRLEEYNMICDVVMVSKDALETTNKKYDAKLITQSFVARHIPEALWEQIDSQ